MSLLLPPRDHAARELFDVADLAVLASVQNAHHLPSLAEARSRARAQFAADKAVRRVHTLVLRACGTLQLVGFGPRGGRQVLWTFGKVGV